MWEVGRRTDGIAMMEVPVYDPSDRKRKSHEKRRDERTRKKREKTEKELDRSSKRVKAEQRE